MIPTLSIVIPVYNTESYLPKCLESILCSKRKDYEIILINDGSCDNSGKICDYYASIKSNIHVIHTDNNGVSSARNRGLELAEGKWITFVDSDDYLEDDIVDKIIIKLYQTKAEMLHFSHIRDTWEKDEIINKTYGKILEGFYNPQNDFLTLFHNDVFDSVCGGVFLRSIIDKCCIRFNKDMKVREDTAFVLEYTRNINKIECMLEYGYHYRLIGREGSNYKRSISINNIELLCITIIRFFNKSIPNDIVPVIGNYIYQLFLCGIIYIIRNNKNKYIDVNRFIKKLINNNMIYKIVLEARCNHFFMLFVQMCLRFKFNKMLALAYCLRLH